jgi:hypothetical protein
MSRELSVSSSLIIHILHLTDRKVDTQIKNKRAALSKGAEKANFAIVVVLGVMIVVIGGLIVYQLWPAK